MFSKLRVAATRMVVEAITQTQTQTAAVFAGKRGTENPNSNNLSNVIKDYGSQRLFPHFPDLPTPRLNIPQPIRFYETTKRAASTTTNTNTSTTAVATTANTNTNDQANIEQQQQQKAATALATTIASATPTQTAMTAMQPTPPSIKPTVVPLLTCLASSRPPPPTTTTAATNNGGSSSSKRPTFQPQPPQQPPRPPTTTSTSPPMPPPSTPTPTPLLTTPPTIQQIATPFGNNNNNNNNTSAPQINFNKLPRIRSSPGPPPRCDPMPLNRLPTPRYSPKGIFEADSSSSVEPNTEATARSAAKAYQTQHHHLLMLHAHQTQAHQNAHKHQHQHQQQINNIHGSSATIEIRPPQQQHQQQQQQQKPGEHKPADLPHLPDLVDIMKAGTCRAVGSPPIRKGVQPYVDIALSTTIQTLNRTTKNGISRLEPPVCYEEVHQKKPRTRIRRLKGC